MQIRELPLGGAYLIVAEPIADARGYFSRHFDVNAFVALGLETNFVQWSSSSNIRRGTLRGLHYQAEPYSEVKLVRCTRGEVFDVIVDMRAKSPTFGRWHGTRIGADNNLTIYVPKGMAHGFMTLIDQTVVDYAISPAFVAEAARGVRFDDPSIGIEWPEPATVISERDRALPMLRAIAPL